MNELKNWNEVTRGLYRYVLAAGVCYEIHICMWRHSTDVLSANSKLYIVGEWNDNTDGDYFERELLLEGPLAACLEAAVEDDKKNINLQ